MEATEVIAAEHPLLVAGLAVMDPPRPRSARLLHVVPTRRSMDIAMVPKESAPKRLGET